MKKIFPIIVVLIALSIVGLIVIQVQWVSNLLVVQGERFLYKVDKAGVSVSEQIGKQTLAGSADQVTRTSFKGTYENAKVGLDYYFSKKDVAGHLAGVPVSVHHQSVSHSIEDVPPDLGSGGVLHHDALLQSRQPVVVDPVTLTGIALLSRRGHPDPHTSADHDVSQDDVVVAVFADDAGGSGADDGIAPDGRPARVGQPDSDDGAVRPIVEKEVVPPERR